MPMSIPEEARQGREIIAALNNDKRLHLLGLLYNAGERLSFRELTEGTGLAGSNLAQHMKPLVQTGLVLNTYQPSEGRDYSFYEISPLGQEWMRKANFVEEDTDEAWLVPA